MTTLKDAIAWAKLWEAMKQGKRFERCRRVHLGRLGPIACSEWEECDLSGLFGDYMEQDLSCLSVDDFRIKPEPPKPTYRQWTLHEIPVGAVARRKNSCSSRVLQVITAADLYERLGDEETAYAVMRFEDSNNTRADKLLKGWEWKWAHEPDTAWRICGVEIP